MDLLHGSGTRPEPRTPRNRLARLGVRAGAGALSGLLLLLAFPPLDFGGHVAIFALVPLCLALRGARAREGAVACAAFGLVFFGVLLYWISYFGWIAWFALVVLMLTALVALFGALAARASAAFGVWGRLVGWPLLFAGVELLRARYPFGGFTWGGLGYTQHDRGLMAGYARLGGVELVTIAVFAMNALIAEGIADSYARRKTPRPPAYSDAVRAQDDPPLGAKLLGPYGRGIIAAATAFLLFAPARLPLEASAGERALDVAVVQGNVPRDRFTGLGRRGRVGPEDFTIVQNHVSETGVLLARGGPRPELVVWPENAFDRDPRATPEILEPTQRVIRQMGVPFLIGAVLDEGDSWTNSNLLFDANGEISARYDKQHLVPFGEYVPANFLRRVVPALDRELPANGTPGRRTVVFDVGGKRVGSVICFESTYPLLVRDFVRAGAEMVVVSTNDASFGTSPAARQHLAMSQMRAIELDRTVVQAAISGISAVILPNGRVVQRTGLFEPAIVSVHAPLRDGLTVYARYGAAIELAMGMLALLFALGPFFVAARRRRARGSGA
jgi:apolipoprotein N-acyltransferase